MKIHFIVCLLLFQNLNFVYAQKAGVDKIVEDFLGNPKVFDVTTISYGDRDEIVQQLRLYVAGNGPDKTIYDDRVGAGFALIRLGDLETINRFINAYNKEAERTGMVSGYISSYETGYISSYLWEGAAQPLLIPLFAEYLPIEDGNRLSSTSGDALMFLFPRSIGSAKIIVGTIKNSPSFTPETRKWAQRMYEILTNGAGINVAEYRKIMVAWWTANKAFFDAKDYESVKPGADPNLASLASPTPEMSPLQTVAPPQASAVPETSSAAAAEKDSTKSPSWPYAAIIAIVLIGAAGFLFVWQRKK